MADLSDDLRLLADGLAVGIIRLDNELIVRYANPAASLFAAPQPGILIGRSLMEAFIDHRIEELAELAGRSGAANSELTLRSADGPSLVVRARRAADGQATWLRSEEHTSELQSRQYLVCRLLLEKK